MCTYTWKYGLLAHFQPQFDANMALGARSGQGVRSDRMVTPGFVSCVSGPPSNLLARCCFSGCLLLVAVSSACQLRDAAPSLFALNRGCTRNTLQNGSIMSMLLQWHPCNWLTVKAGCCVDTAVSSRAAVLVFLVAVVTVAFSTPSLIGKTQGKH